MKYIFYLLVLCLIFSLGMYVGVDRNSHALPVESKVEEKEHFPEISDETDRDRIVEEVKKSHYAPQPAEPTILQEVAFKGEVVVKGAFDQFIHFTSAFVEGIF